MHSNIRSLGETITDRRKDLKITRADLERATKIKNDFLIAIENGTWEKLPEFPVVQGFVRSIAHILEMNESLLLALLRRDYPRKSFSMAPKPDVKNKFIWSPKWTLITGAVVVTFLVLGYLGFQYKQFVSPPTLEVLRPSENETIKTHTYTVTGRTNPDATVIINNQPALVFDDGTFEDEIEIAEGTNEVIVKATSRSGKITEVRRAIMVELE